ncbi:MAG: CoA-binding protein [Paracoccaceae bacterium]|nr:CoA-binding protein [Paracoccaceae bacterium]
MIETDDEIREVLTRARVIAVIGASANPDRPSHYVAEFLKNRGKRVIGVNPGLAGQTMFGEAVCASIADLPPEVDMIDIFRQTDAVPGIVDEALAHLPGLQTVWMQLGIAHPEAAARATAQGVTVIQNRCPKIEYPRLFGR